MKKKPDIYEDCEITHQRNIIIMMFFLAILFLIVSFNGGL